MKKLLIFLIISLTLTIVNAQNTGIKKATKESIKSHFYRLYTSVAEKEQKDSLSKNITIALNDYLFNDNADFLFFDSINNLKYIHCDDKLKVFSWCFNDDVGVAHHSAFLFITPEGQPPYSVTLTDTMSTSSLRHIKYLTLTKSKWFGALYYKIKKIDNKYLLLGWRGANNLINQKIIEVLEINKGKLLFGAKIFDNKYRKDKRIIFKYSLQATMNLTFTDNNITFDCLAPLNPSLKGIYEYYGPVLSRTDAFELKNNKLYFKEDIDVRNAEVKKGMPYKREQN